MSEAPERIWMDPDIKFPECEKQYGCDVEYVRADMLQEIFARYSKAESAHIEELEAKNKRLNEQMDAIEEMGTESLNALPDCLMRLAPALVENEELKAKLAKAVEERDEALNQLDSARHSVGVLEERVAELEAVLGVLVFCEDAEFYPGAIEKSSPYCIDFEEWHKTARTALKGQDND